MSSAVSVVRELVSREVPRPEIQELRERILLGLLLMIAAFGIVPITLGVLTAVEQGQTLFPVVYIGLYALLIVSIVARRYIPYGVRGSVVVVLGLAFSVAVLVRLGLSGSGLELLTVFVVGATVLFGLRVGAAAMVFGAVAIAVVGAGVISGDIPIKSELLLTSYMALPWVNAVAIFVLMTVVLALAPQVLMRRLTQLVDQRERDASELARANERLRAEIDQRERAESAQRTSEERFENLVNILPEAVYETDTSGKFTYVNQSALDVFGFHREEMGRVTALDVLVEKERAMSNIMRAIGGEHLGLSEYTAIRKDGTRFPVLVRSVPIRDGDAVVGLRGLVIDVTERKRLEAQLQQAQKMEAIGTLAGGLAHDFNNLLMGIQGRVSLMLSDPVADPRDHLISIEEYVRSAADLTTRLLGFARGGRYQVAPTDISTLVRRSIDLFGRTRKDLEPHTSFTDDCVADVDHRQMEQVLLNLLVNAWQAMPDGGELYVETGLMEIEAAEAATHEVEPGTYVHIDVRDTGVGMSRDVRERVFEPFFTTKEMGRGTGLGLASAYGIVRNHGGFIVLESEEGAGSLFRVFLPRSTGTVETQANDEVAASQGHGTVLLVDDEAVVLEVCRALLERLGYQVVCAHNGAEAVEKFGREPGRFDLVILDLVMPEQGGGQVFDELVAIDPSARILIASGYSVDGEATALLERGAVGFLMKPFSLEQLSTQLAEVLGEASGLEGKQDQDQ